MFDRYLVMKNNDQEYLYLYINDYSEFSNEFNTKFEKGIDLKNLIYNYINNRNITFKGTKVFLVVAGLVVSYIIIDNTVPVGKKWISDFEPINTDNDKSEIINDLIDKKVEINIPTNFK